MKPPIDSEYSVVNYLIYVCFLLSVITMGLTLFLGGSIALLYRPEYPYYESHRKNQVTIFVITSVLLLLVLGLTLVFGQVAYLGLFPIVLWLVIRSKDGLNHIHKGEPIQNPTSWWISQ